jgi:hypothetical protein
MNDYILPQCKIERIIYENCYLYNFHRYAEQNNIEYNHLITGIDNIFNIYILKNTKLFENTLKRVISKKIDLTSTLFLGDLMDFKSWTTTENTILYPGEQRLLLEITTSKDTKWELWEDL